jgi:hypothetical protein
MAPLLPFHESIQQLTGARLSRTGSDPATSAAKLAAIPAPLRSWKEQTEARRKEAAASKAPPPVSPSTALRAAAATDAIRQSLEAWFRFHDGYQPDFSWWTRQPYAKAHEALEQHARYLREELAAQKGQPDDPLVGDPIGPDALAAGIGRELIPYSASELIAIAEREFAWCEDQLRHAAEAMRCTTRDALETVKRAHVPPGGQADLAAAEAVRAIAFLRKHDLVTIPPLCEEIWRLEMIPPDAQKTLPYAVYGQPAMRVAYPTDAMAHEDKLAAMRGNNRHFLRIVTRTNSSRATTSSASLPTAPAHGAHSSVPLSSSKAGPSTGKCSSGTSTTPIPRKIKSACSSGACTAAPASSYPSASTSAPCPPRK